VTIGATRGRILSAYRPASPPAESKPEKKKYTRAKPAPSVMPVTKRTFTVEVIKGNKRSEEKFQ
jgi:hypothetical protein